MIVPINTLQIGGNGQDSPNPTFLQTDIQTLYNQYGATNSQLRNSINLSDNKQIVALYGLNGNTEVGVAALPCPPYCGSGRGGGAALRAGSRRSFKDSLAFLQSGTWPAVKVSHKSVKMPASSVNYHLVLKPQFLVGGDASDQDFPFEFDAGAANELMAMFPENSGFIVLNILVKEQRDTAPKQLKGKVLFDGNGEAVGAVLPCPPYCGDEVLFETAVTNKSIQNLLKK